MPKKINYREIKYLNHSADPVGRLFYWRGKLFRGIKSDNELHFKKMFDVGLIKELVKEKLIPPTSITNYYTDDYDFVLEHKKIDRVTYPYEWSFSMLQDALLTILKVNIVALKFGYQTKDGHVYNIVFDKYKPFFVDIGSLIKSDYKYWAGYREFVWYFKILKRWSSGNFYFANRFISDCYTTRYFSLNNKFNVNNIRHLYLILFSNINLVNFFVYQMSRVLSRAFPVNGYIFSIHNFSALFNKVDKLTYRKRSSVWGNYHDQYYGDNDVVSSKRFNRIAEIAQNLGDIKSATDLASNQGVFSRILMRKIPVKDIVCMDNDEIAIEMFYRRLRGKAPENKIITPVLQNMILPLAANYDDTSVYNRLKSEAVFALAIIHHLVLSQNFYIADVFEKIERYSTKYVFIEFMPMGLYGGTNPVKVPSWYSIDWFRNNFKVHFNLIKEEKLEKNRIIFVGEIKK